jgi:hypothetical protein
MTSARADDARMIESSCTLSTNMSGLTLLLSLSQRGHKEEVEKRAGTSI